MDPNQRALLGWISILAATVNSGCSALSLADGEYAWAAVQGLLAIGTAWFAYVNLRLAEPPDL